MASSSSKRAFVVAGLAGLVAGALSMAAGEYVSVSAQRDAEDADIVVEKAELHADPAGELIELAQIYQARGLDADLARKVAEQLSAHDRLQSHLRDELGINDEARARPLQAAAISAASFASLALFPLVAAGLAPAGHGPELTAGVALASLAILGTLGGHLAGSSKTRGALRVLAGGGLAMAISAGIGHLVHLAGL
jgi:VIT1/CCC1 family predicted Fe2+/Mn2+ transporter